SILTGGFFIVEPNGSKVVMLFGTYKGTQRTPGLHWANPFYTKRGISLRARTLNGQILKVNDKTGNPVEIAAIILWKVADTYEASFEVNDYDSFVAMQSETAMRHLASSFPYDTDGTELSLMHNTDEVSTHLMTELQERLRRAGVEVLEARLSHLAYAPEIAGVMLRRQQAAAVVAARTRIVDGAVGMVKQALEKLMHEGVVELDDERKAQMVTNLMVVLCGEQPAQPVLNAGTLYA
ncbi:MAG TPA: SPFH domain-containing protein, partial [Fimbriimonadaceae bacterium]|nr:SPFH domain-containing protein [Fimbriimonadaceae bacterium]